MKNTNVKLLSVVSGMLQLIAEKNISTASAGTMYQPKAPASLKAGK